MNSDTIVQGLFVTVVGMGLVFLALGFLVAAMELMGRYLRASPSYTRRKHEREASGEERTRVAAMAAAIVLAGEPDEGGPGGAWRWDDRAGTPSPWQASHRTQLLTCQPRRSGERGSHP